MNPVPVDRLKQYYRFEEWRGRRSRVRGALVDRASFDPLPGWTLHTLQEIEHPGMPRLIQSIWRVEGEAPATGAKFAPVAPVPLVAPAEVLLKFDLYVCESRTAAHDFLIVLLAQLQAPGLKNEPDPEPGDVAFRNAASTSQLFARGRYVVFLSSAGRVPYDVRPLGANIDKLIAEPDVEAERASTASESEVEPREIAEQPRADDSGAKQGGPIQWLFLSKTGAGDRRQKPQVSTMQAGEARIRTYEIGNQASREDRGVETI
jgi:hypothetical protein